MGAKEEEVKGVARDSRRRRMMVLMMMINGGKYIECLSIGMKLGSKAVYMYRNSSKRCILCAYRACLSVCLSLMTP